MSDSAQLCKHCVLPIPRSRGTDPYCCFGCRIAAELARPATTEGDDQRSGDTLLLRLGIGIFLAMNVNVFSWLFYSTELFGVGGSPSAQQLALASVFSWLLLFLSSIVVVTLGLPLVEDCWRAGGVGANLLIVFGSFSAFVLSVVNTVVGSGKLYYDTTVMILVLVTLGNYLESRARQRATRAALDIEAAVPRQVTIERQGRPVAVRLEDVVVGDTVHARPGEGIAVDGVVVSGRSYVDESRLTGESRPRSVADGDTVLAGSVNLDGVLRIEAVAVGDSSVIAGVRRLLEDARQQKPKIQRLADRAAEVFVPLVMLVALAVFIWHTRSGDAARGLFDALSVLLISCPCALGLAAPLAIHVALGRLAAAGVIVDSALTLERAASVTRVFFDKTGTLTAPELVVRDVVPTGSLDQNGLLQLAASLEATSLHPLGLAVVAEARVRAIELAPVRDAFAIPGLGLEGRVAERRLFLGSARLMVERGLDVGPAQQTADTAIYLADEVAILGQIRLTERVREEAAATVAQLRMQGIAIEVLTGDQSGPAARLADALRVEVHAGLLPKDKLDHIATARRVQRCRVAMVGDGINDAPVLAGADVGFVVGRATDLARRAGNIQLRSDSLTAVPYTLETARQAMRRIRLSLSWAFAYNAVGVVLAALGLLNPIMAAAAMVGSSLLVVRLSSGGGFVPADELSVLMWPRPALTTKVAA